MLKALLKILPKIGTVALVAYIAWMGWEHLGPRKPEIGPIRKELAAKVIPDIVEDIRNSRGKIGRTALLHFSNDPTDHFTDTLRDLVEQRGVLDLDDRTVMEKTWNLLNLRHTSYASPEAALSRGKDLDAESVLFGAIHAFESYPGGAKIDVDITLANV